MANFTQWAERQMVEIATKAKKGDEETVRQRVEQLHFAQAGFRSLYEWMELPRGSLLAPAPLALAEAAWQLALASGESAAVLSAAVEAALKMDQPHALDWLKNKGFDFCAESSPSVGSFYFYDWGDHPSRQSGPHSWLNAAVAMDAYGCARKMGEWGILAQSPMATPAAGSTNPGPAPDPAKAAKPIKRTAAQQKKWDANQAAIQEMLERQKTDPDHISRCAEGMQDCHPLFRVLVNQSDRAPAGFERELMEERYGLGVDAQAPIFKLALARCAADGNERAIAMALGFGVGVDEGGLELCQVALEKSAGHLKWALAKGRDYESAGDKKARLRSGGLLMQWFDKTGVQARLAAQGASLSDGYLLRHAYAVESALQNRDTQEGQAELKEAIEALPVALGEAPAHGKLFFPPPSQTALKRAREELTGALLSLPESGRSPRDEKGMVKSRELAQRFMDGLSERIIEPKAKRSVLKA